MKIFKTQSDLQQYISQEKKQGKTIGFVPTMGALHQGHLSLIAMSKATCDHTVASIFVNPTQFNDPADFEKYPVTIEQDITLLTQAGCDMLLLPNVAEMYPSGTGNLEQYELGSVADVLDGAARPGHFQGVAQVVNRLLNAVLPNTLFLGQKDYQQCLVIKNLLALRTDQIKLQIVPTKREADGLAMSSRNKRLNDGQRALSTLLYQCLVSIEAQQGLKPFSIIHKECIDILQAKGFKPDYVHLADAETLEILEDYPTDRPSVALIAAFIGDVRLIDNLPLKRE